MNYDLDVYLDDKRDSTLWAFYLQDEFEVLKNLRINAGVRYDHYSTFGGTANPRIAIIYHPFDKTVFKLIYGQAFRAPNVYELYYKDVVSQKSNPSLDPERIQTLNFIYQQYLGFNVWGTASLYTNWMKDLINQELDEGDGFLVFRNMDKVRSSGLELELEGRWKGGFQGNLSYSFQKTENQETGETLTNSPRHLVKFNGILPLLKEKLFLGVEEQYSSGRKTLAGRSADGFFMTNLTLFSKEFVKGLEVSASLYNLFNKKYEDPASGDTIQDTLAQDGRNFRFKVTYRF